MTLGLKFGVLLNGFPHENAPALLGNLDNHIKDLLKDMTGLNEIDGRESEDGKTGEEITRLHGAFEALAFVGDTFIRRFSSPKDNADLFVMQYRLLN